MPDMVIKLQAATEPFLSAHVHPHNLIILISPHQNWATNLRRETLHLIPQRTIFANQGAYFFTSHSVFNLILLIYLT